MVYLYVLELRFRRKYGSMCLEHHALELGVSGIKKLVCGDQRLVPVQAKAKS